MRNIAALVIAAIALTISGCSVNFPLSKVKPTTINVKWAKTLLASIGEYPETAAKLAKAQAYYDELAFVLRERRSTLRSRQRVFSTISFGAFVATTIAIGAVSIGSDDARAVDTVRITGGSALAGLAVGTFFHVANLVQENTSSMDAKLRELDESYNAMLGRLHEIIRDVDRSAQELEKPDSGLVEAEMDATIKAFFTAANRIHIKG